MATASMSKKAASKIFCDHCQSFVGKSTYCCHWARYYNQQGKRWERSNGNITESSSSESEGESSEPITETTNDQVLTALGCRYIWLIFQQLSTTSVIGLKSILHQMPKWSDVVRQSMVDISKC